MGLMEEKIKNLLGSKIIDSGIDRNQYWILVNHKEIIDVVKSLTTGSENLFDMLTDICGVDNSPEVNRFQVVYHLLSTQDKFRLRIKVNVPADTMTVPSIVNVFKGANWLERETYDMYGIRFEGHPDMRRILMHEDFLDFPLRKDFPLRGWREED